MGFGPRYFQLDGEISVAHVDYFHANFLPTLIGLFSVAITCPLGKRSVKMERKVY